MSVTGDVHDRVIHVDSVIPRGPDREGKFMPHGDLVPIASHHELPRAPADELREAVEARWRAFGGEAARGAAARSGSGSRRLSASSA